MTMTSFSSAMIMTMATTAAIISSSSAFSPITTTVSTARTTATRIQSSASTSTSIDDQKINGIDINIDNNNIQQKPLFDFTTPYSTLTPDNDINKFDRIDDAIMGGISTSSLKFIPNQPYASWSGICRTDGGGFCGMRTLPFVEPLQVEDVVTSTVDIDNNDSDSTTTAKATGLFLTCRLASDDEPERRTWKMTLRTDSQRGEIVFQASYKLSKSVSTSTSTSTTTSGPSNDKEWQTIYVPFDSFQQVKGPRIVPNGEKLDISKGVYQVGMTMSKFQIGVNTTEQFDFRPGFFELQIQQIGFYYDNVVGNGNADGSAVAVDNVDNAVNTIESEPSVVESSTNEEETKITTSTTTTATSNTARNIQTLTKDEMMKQRSLILKVALTISKIFFSEKANRRKSAMNILRTKRNMSRLQAISFGIQQRKASAGGNLYNSIGKTVSIVGIDVLRTVLKKGLTFGVVYPFKLIKKLMGFVKGNKGKDGVASMGKE